MSLLSKLFGKSADRTSAPPEADENWVLAERNGANGISLIRVRGLPAAFDFASSKFRLSITWSYAEQDDAGTPSSAELERMNRFELLVRRHIEATGAGLLVVIFTEASFRQYEFCARDVKRFIKMLNQIPAQREPFPIEIREEPDETGAFYRSYAKGLVDLP